MQNATGKSTSPSVSRRLFSDQVQKQFEHTLFGTAATLINSVLLVFVLRAHVPHKSLLFWLICAGLVSVCRLLLNWAYHRSTNRSESPETWNVWFLITLFLSGVLWGASSLFMYSSDSIGHQAFIAFVAGGMVAGAVSSFTAVLAAFFIFTLPALVPICLSFFILGGEMHMAMGTMILLYLAIMCMAATRMHKNILNLLSLRYERIALIANLQEEVEQRKAAQKKLHRQKDQVEEIVTQRTAQLKNANQRLRAVLNYAPLAIWAFDEKAVMTFADGKGLRKMGLGAENTVGRSIFDLFPDNKPFIDISMRVLTGEFVSDTIVFDAVSFEVRYQPLIDAASRVAGAIGVAIDVTEQTAAKEALRKSKEQYQELVENINDVIYAIDRDGVITYISPVIESVLGYRADELIGESFFNFIYYQDLDRMQEDFRKAKDRIGSQRDYRFLDKAGDPKWCRVNSRPISNGHKKVGLQGVLVDIDWSKRLEEQLLRAQKMEALGTLAGGVAHDLNNILSGIISIPELLLIDLPDDSPVHRSLTIVKESGENAAAVVQDLLTLARRGVPLYECINLNDIIRRCLDTSEMVALLRQHPEVHLKTSLDPNLLNMYGSSTHIFKSVSNLMMNAMEAMPDGGSLEIETGNRYADSKLSGFDTVEEGEYVVLSIRDSGIGISENDQAKIFEPFYTNKVMGRNGSGLGMAVVWGAVKDHGGYIDLRSTEGEGTRFDLFFPATRDQLQSEEKPEDVSDLMGHGELVIVVDDMPAQREIATRILERLGFNAMSFASGEEAIEFLRQDTAELLILDMILDPGIDGYETYRRINGIRPGLPAIIASGYSETDRVKKTLELGAGKYVKKPYTLTTIGKAIKEVLRN